MYRLYDSESGEAFADVMCLYDEVIDDTKPIELFDPENTWKKKHFSNFTAKSILEPIFRGGKLVYRVPTIEEARDYCDRQIRRLWEEVKRFENPHRYYVDLSPKLWRIKNDMLEEMRHI